MEAIEETDMDIDGFIDQNLQFTQNNEDIKYLEQQYDQKDATQGDQEYYDLLADFKTIDPSVKFYIVTNLERLVRTCSQPVQSQKVLSQITSMEFINGIIGYSELIYEYIKQIQALSKTSSDKLIYLNALENILNDSLERYIIEKIEWAIFELICSLGNDEQLQEQSERIMNEFYQSNVVAKKTSIFMIITQLYEMVNENTKHQFSEIFLNGAQGTSSVMKRKICQNLPEAIFIEPLHRIEMLEEFLKDPNEYVRIEATNAISRFYDAKILDYSKFIDILKDIFENPREKSWRVKYSLIEVVYKTIKKLSIENLNDPAFVSFLQVYFELDNEENNAMHNIIGIDCIFSWAQRVFMNKVDESINNKIASGKESSKYSKSSQNNSNDPLFLSNIEHFILLCEQMIKLFSHKNTHYLVKQKICLGISKIVTIPVSNKDLKYMYSKLLSELRHQFLKHPNKYSYLFKEFLDDLNSKLMHFKEEKTDIKEAHGNYFNIFDCPPTQEIESKESSEQSASEIYQRMMIKNFRKIIRPELIELVSKPKVEEKWLNRISILNLMTLLLQDELYATIDEYLEELTKKQNEDKEMKENEEIHDQDGESPKKEPHLDDFIESSTILQYFAKKYNEICSQKGYTEILDKNENKDANLSPQVNVNTNLVNKEAIEIVRKIEMNSYKYQNKYLARANQKFVQNYIKKPMEVS
ncbi:unnamed protein product [Moneuplotes crassus]|uniref:Armadillo-type fold n=1 Tax=Euplotes crassus TaxID=5936 RepID=A0AAD2DAU6_EUPCR|nr:unnamed protein product [Moneuplotes crassus]